MSGLTDLIRGRRAQEVRVWREEEDEAKATETKAVWGSLGLLVAQRFQSAEEQAEVTRGYSRDVCPWSTSSGTGAPT
jgi:hypothetical protein